MATKQTPAFRTALVQLPLVVQETVEKVHCPADVCKTLPEASTLAQEAFFVLTLNGKNAVINKHLVTLGVANSALIHPREVFRPAILDGAVSIIAAHNHPNGDPTPSPEDIRTTKQLNEAGELLQIKLLDHVIIGHGATPYKSLQEAGLMK